MPPAADHGAAGGAAAADAALDGAQRLDACSGDSGKRCTRGRQHARNLGEMNIGGDLSLIATIGWRTVLYQVSMKACRKQ